MNWTRREFVSGMAAATLARRLSPPAVPATLDPNQLRRYIAPLPRLRRAQPMRDGHYRISLREAGIALHPDLPPTRCWTYDGAFPGPVINARSGEPLTVEWVNALPARHFLPVDHSLHGAARSLPPVRSVVHLHGARVPAASDGYPDQWTVPGGVQHCEYPNRQDPATLFYHDHTMGIGRLNVYAGLVGAYLLRDGAEADSEFDLPLVLCDRWLDPHGQLYYPTSGVPGHPWIPELMGNAMLVNGALWPRLDVEPAIYRLRLINVANSRFFHLGFAPSATMNVIASDQGLLTAPVPLESLLLAPAERAEIMVDFRPYAGQQLHLCNDGQPILQVRVATRQQTSGAIVPAPQPIRRATAIAATRIRQLTLDEYAQDNGLPQTMLLNGKYWHDPVTETPRLGDIELWEFLNLGDDTHPIHLHMVRFQVLERQPFDADQFLLDRTVRTTGPAAPPAPEEMGWKDTVRCYAGAITRIVVQFEGYAGRYVWHCHVLEHEANEMMRPYEILPVPVPDPA